MVEQRVDADNLLIGGLFIVATSPIWAPIWITHHFVSRETSKIPIERAQVRLDKGKKINKNFTLIAKDILTLAFSELICTDNAAEVFNFRPSQSVDSTSIAAHISEIAKGVMAQASTFGQLYEAPEDADEAPPSYE